MYRTVTNAGIYAAMITEDKIYGKDFVFFDQIVASTGVTKHLEPVNTN